MSQHLIFGLPAPFALVLLALRRPAAVRIAGRRFEAPYKIETPPPHGGRLDVVPQAGRDPANR